MPDTDFTHMFHPRGIAIIGASGDSTRPGSLALNALTQRGYKGGIYPVNPKYTELQGHRCYASVADIGQPCDLAVIALSAAHVADAVTQCSSSGIRFAIVMGGGFREVGSEGIEHERRMLAAARSTGVRLIGPNCLGLVNVHDNVFPCFGSLSRPPYHKPGPVSAVLQSGGFGGSLLATARTAGVGFRYLVASGQESDIGAPELIRAYVDDKETRVIFAYLEGIADGRAFMEAARYALNAGKPVVVLKSGNTTQGRNAAASHTASMTGTYDIYKAAFKQCGVIEATDLQEMADFLSCLSVGKWPNGRNVAVTAGSGGSIVNFSDACDAYDLNLAPFTEQTKAVLRKHLPAIATKDNPVDYTTGFISEKNNPIYTDILRAILSDRGIDQLAIFHPTTVGDTFSNTIRTVISAVKGSEKPVMVLSCMPLDMTVEGRTLLNEANIPVLGSPRRTAACMAMLANYAASRRKPELLSAYEAKPHSLPKLPEGVKMLDEFESKQLISAFGIPVSKDALLPIDSPVSSLPQGMRYPVAVKIVSRDIGHKTDIGAVQLNVRDDKQLAEAMAKVVVSSRQAVPTAQLSGVLIAEMVSGGLETIVGVVNDPLFGPVIAFGLGGVLAETLRDTTYRVAPFGLETAREMVNELRAAAVFAGVRGQHPRDIEALAVMLVRISECAWLLRDRIAELDINPVFVCQQGQGVIAADALVILK